jgi:hypothetical protein
MTDDTGIMGIAMFVYYVCWPWGAWLTVDSLAKDYMRRQKGPLPPTRKRGFWEEWDILGAWLVIGMWLCMPFMTVYLEGKDRRWW